MVSRESDDDDEDDEDSSEGSSEDDDEDDPEEGEEESEDDEDVPVDPDLFAPSAVHSSLRATAFARTVELRGRTQKVLQHPSATTVLVPVRL